MTERECFPSIRKVLKDYNHASLSWYVKLDYWNLNLRATELALKVKMKVPWLCPTLCDPMDSLWVHEDSPDMNTGVGCHAILEGVFPTQGSNPGLPHCRQIVYHLNHQGSPRIQKWVAYAFSRESLQLRDWTQVSHIAGRLFTSWAIREAQEYWSGYPIPSPADLHDPGIKLGSPAPEVDSLPDGLQ